MEPGLIHLYCGEGKGKTTAAVGMAVRCAGTGKRVLLVQFLKDYTSGEIAGLSHIPQIQIWKGTPVKGFSRRFTEEQRIACEAIHNQNLSGAIQLCREKEIELLILDEVVAAWNLCLLDRSILLGFLRNKPAGLEVVLTGRNPPSELVVLADYVSEIRKVKHPFDQGIKARAGIEK